MTEYLTEQEQIELLKRWFKQYSLVILAGVAIALLAVSAWRFWQQRENTILNHASLVYDEMLAQRVQNNPTTTLIQAQKLYSHYPQTIYGQLAALMLGGTEAQQGQYMPATDKFNWVIAHSHVASFRQIARLRLARVLIAQHQYQESIDLLQTVDDAYFASLIAEIKGDAYLGMHDLAMARQAYGQALAASPNADVAQPLLQMKYDDLAN